MLIRSIMRSCFAPTQAMLVIKNQKGGVAEAAQLVKVLPSLVA